MWIDYYQKFELNLMNLTNLINELTYHLGKTRIATLWPQASVFCAVN